MEDTLVRSDEKWEFGYLSVLSQNHVSGTERFQCLLDVA